jgi:hypothetical protein
MPFAQLFPYDYGGAGDINSTIEDIARWVRLKPRKRGIRGKAPSLARKSGHDADAKGGDQ